ncbi:MerR family transcriptional regulator [Virgibacillus sp. DJP39]|uniref:MerR family transcriptional regulator n=1 Tax=Virgibacillus sp. DJP39 TaxID=3409790 RepID=UPI003BB7EF3F
MSEPPRTESGYRKFHLEVAEDIKFIKRTQDLGFTLEENKSLLATSNNYWNKGEINLSFVFFR